MNAPLPPTIEAVSAAGLELSYGGTKVLRGIDFRLDQGETLALLGPSGCGKTSLLRLVAGLLTPDKGRIALAGQLVADAGARAFVPPEARGLGMVFQDYALWPHLDVGGNVAFPLEMRGIGRAEREARTARALDRVGLAGFAGRKPGQLSGGQQQRVAIARAIVGEPRLILFDEPLSNLDRELRETMIGEIGSLIAGLGLTAIYVTHDHDEALTLADQVAVMRAGVIEQWATPDRLVAQPASPAIAEFLRLGAVVPVEPAGSGWRLAGSAVAVPGDSPVSDASHVLLPAAAVRPVAAADAHDTGVVLRSRFGTDGHVVTLRVAASDPPIELQFTTKIKPRLGEVVGFVLDARHIRWFAGSQKNAETSCVDSSSS